MPVRKVTDPALLQQLGGGQIVAPNPMFPGQMQGQSLNNAGQGLQNQRYGAELPYVAPKAAAEASNAQTTAGVNAATAPAEIVGKRGNAQKSAAEGQAASTNLQVSGGADSTQAKSASFYNRALKSNQMFEGTGIKDQPYGHVIAQTLLPGALVNKYTSPERQISETAKRDFISSTLRQESGAAIAQSEFDNQEKIYFPQPGDGPETITAKAKLRQNAIDGLRLSAGPSAPMVEQPQQGIASTSLADIGKPTFRSEFDPETSAATDKLIRMGRPPHEIAAFTASRGYPVTPEELASIAEAQLYLKQHHDYKGGFTQASRPKEMSLGEKVAGSPLGAFGAAAGNAATLGLADEAAGAIGALRRGDYTQDRDAFNAKKQLLSDAHPYADFAGTVAGSGLAMGGIGAAAKGVGLASRVGASRASTLGDIAYGSGFGAGENNDNRGLGAIEGGAAAYGGNLLGRGAAKTLGALVSPTGGKLASLYEMGVRPSIGQRFGGVANNVEEKLKSIPVLGDMIEGTRDRARDQFQAGLFNKALGEIGTALPKGMKPGHDAHAFAQKAFNDAYDTAKSNMTAAADSGLATDLGSLQRTVSTLRPDSQNAFNKLWADSVGRRFSAGALSGPAYKDATSEIERRIAKIRSSQSGDGELADALQDAVDALRGSAMRNSHPDAVAAMDAADRGYQTMVQIETASKAAGGEAATFSPKQFESAVKGTNSTVRKRGFLAGKAPNTDLASAGLNLQDVVSNSGTIDRLLPAATLLGTGFMSPKAAAVMGAYGLANAPGIRNVTTSLLAPRGGKAKTLADLIRKQSGLLGTIGSGVGISLLPSK